MRQSRPSESKQINILSSDAALRLCLILFGLAICLVSPQTKMQLANNAFTLLHNSTSTWITHGINCDYAVSRPDGAVQLFLVYHARSKRDEMILGGDFSFLIVHICAIFLRLASVMQSRLVLKGCILIGT